MNLIFFGLKMQGEKSLYFLSFPFFFGGRTSLQAAVVDGCKYAFLQVRFNAGLTASAENITVFCLLLLVFCTRLCVTAAFLFRFCSFPLDFILYLLYNMCVLACSRAGMGVRWLVLKKIIFLRYRLQCE